MRRAFLLLAVPGALGGCDDMSVQPKQKVYSPSSGPRKYRLAPWNMMLSRRGRHR
jgi:hypothetical protein